jgi:hypothetical protein
MSVSAKAQNASDTSDFSINVSYSLVNGKNLGKKVVNFKKPATESQPGFNALLDGYGVNDLALITADVDAAKISDDQGTSKKMTFIVDPARNTLTIVNETVGGRIHSRSIFDDRLQGKTPGEYLAAFLAPSPVFAPMGFGSTPDISPDQINNPAGGIINSFEPITRIDITYFPVPVSANVKYVNEINKQTVKSDSISGYLGETGTYTPKVPAGYQLVNSDPIPYTLAKDNSDDLTVNVVPVSTPITPTPDSGNNTLAVTPQKNDAWNPTSSDNKVTSEPAVPNYAAVKGVAVYATNHIYMYKKATFAKSQRIAKYPKAKRVDRPMFVVTDYARSKAGTLRYKVRDVNHGSKTAGKVGYITANRKFIIPVYYKSVPKNNKITIISKRGVHAYRNVNLTNHVKHYKKGVRLTVKKIAKHNLTTRYQLTNGSYVTANKKLVIQRNY